MAVLYLEKDRIPEYEHARFPDEYGILFRFATVEIYSRYDGTGEYNITLDKYGDMHIETVVGQSIYIKMPGMVLKK